MLMRTFIFLFFFSLVTSSVSKNTIKDQIGRGSSLSVEDDSHVIMSLDKSFTCGFYIFQSNAYWFAIWYTNSKDRTVVWTANRNTPVNGRGSKLRLRKTGAMVLTNVDGTIVWETNTTSTDVSIAVLLNTGHLVLKNQKGEILWQSFYHPTDTLLPSQILTKSKSLISALRSESFEYGYFGLIFNSINVLTLVYDGPEISIVYWPSPDPGIFNASDRMSFTATDLGMGIRRRLTLDYDGNLRLYSLNESSGLWLISWQALAQACNVHGICGKNGICIHGDKPECSCPPGYELSDRTDLSHGCKPTFNQTCDKSTRFKILPLPYTDYYGFDLNFSSPISFEARRDICLKDCRCEAFSYRLTGTMYFKVPVGMESQKYASILTGSNTTCADIMVMIGSPFMYESDTNMVKLVYLNSFTSAIGVLEALDEVAQELCTKGSWKMKGGGYEKIGKYGAFQPKISDFGLAKLSQRSGQNTEFTRIRGTKGYMAPEWARSLPITAKVDVYSYEVVVLELLKGIRLPNFIVHGEGKDEESELMRFVRVTKKEIEEERELWIEEVIDPRLGGLFSRRQAVKLAELGLSCVEEDRNRRPTMDSVVQHLIDCESD
uniref:Putative receptor protein kinase ZmPK1 n=1 Tax=Tanacetum cinerariifolium TaxID=118510 RepID=A0A6L2MAY7_TANCI|nr:putative receptor protein kinase ZmPK1 [Tanacetum cinerariifolium]